MRQPDLIVRSAIHSSIVQDNRQVAERFLEQVGSFLEVSKTMKLTIRSLALVGIVAMCLIAVPALSAPTEDGASKTHCNASEKSGCNAFQPGMGPQMGHWGNPEMGMHGKEAFGMMKEKNGSWKNEKGNATKAIEIRKSGSGFAMSGNNNHVLRMNIEGKMKPDFAGIKNLISDNKTLGQIKSEMKAKMDAEISAASYNGSLHLGQSNYNLLNIKLAVLGNNSSTINADVAGPKLNAKDKPTAVVGHITVTTSRQENSTIGVGTLTMNSGQNNGQYKVLIDMKRGMGDHNGMKGCSFGCMNQKGERFGMNKEMGKPEDKVAKKA